MQTTITIRKNKRILVGITGGIAAYKSPDLVRRLIERGADVRVVMSAAAEAFITPLTLQAVSGHPVLKHLLDADAESGMGHIELARWAEMIVVAPATANFIAKMAYGKADDLLSTLILASEAVRVIAPAMNQQMWQNDTTQDNLRRLQNRGVKIIGPAEGNQACGEIGPGRMTQPEEIAQLLLGDGTPQLLAGKTVLITAGPTWEAIDPVRGVTNHSSGKMGFAMAAAAKDFGATVVLVCGPVSMGTPTGVERINVQSAKQMHEQVFNHIDRSQFFIAVAAVADYRPLQQSSHKLKKDEDEITIKLTRNPDILADVAQQKSKVFSVGFAAETQNLIENAHKKLVAKNIDLVVANDVSGEEGAFGNDTNQVTLVHKNGTTNLQRTDKYRLAVHIMEHIYQQYETQKQDKQNDAKTD